MAATVLLLESEPSLRKVVAASLQQNGLRILQAEDAEAARQQLDEEEPDLFVLELDHPAGEHGSLIEAYRQRCGGGPVVLTTTERPEEAWRRRYRPEAVVYKPYDVRLLARRIRALIPGDGLAEEPPSGGTTDDPNDRR
jgi:DNA-binding response OmpR family regulator